MLMHVGPAPGREAGLVPVEGAGSGSEMRIQKLTSGKRSISFEEQEEEEDGKESPAGGSHGMRRGGKAMESFKDVCGEEIVASVHKQIQEVLYKRRPWYLWKRTFLFAFIVLPAFAIFSLEYPARGAKSLVQFAPAVMLATHRQYLSKRCGLLVRELVLGDGFTRQRVEEIAWQLKEAVEQMSRVDKALRLGGDMGNDKGTDSYSKKHNDVMYKEGCMWRQEAHHCDVSAYPGVAFKGLYSYIQAYMTAVRTVLARYGPPESEHTEPRGGMPSKDDDFRGVRADLHDRLRIMEDDPDLRYILENFDGDLQQGFDLVSVDLYEDSQSVLDNVRLEARAFFGTYIAALILFYIFLFRRVQAFAADSALRARSFVIKTPAYLLPAADVETMINHFNKEIDRDEPDTQDAQDGQEEV